MAKSSSGSGNSSSKSLLFMMIAMTCGFGALLSGGMFLASRVIQAMQLRVGSDKTTVRTPLGDFRMEKAEQVGPGLPVYPQSNLVLPGVGSSRISLTDNSPQVLSSTYHTGASREAVAIWYAEHLSQEFARQDNGPKTIPEVFHNSHIIDDDVIFVGVRGDQVRVVSLSNDEAGTRITLLRAATQLSTAAPVQSLAPTQ
jgi:hypothetical protein